MAEQNLSIALTTCQVGKLWLLNPGTGEFGYVDLQSGRFEPVVFCPGYMRGLYFYGDYALIGLPNPRHNKTFDGLSLDGSLKKYDESSNCGVYVVDLRTSTVAHWLFIDGVVDELYDIITLPGVTRPMALGFMNE